MSNTHGERQLGETIRAGVLAATSGATLADACETIRRTGVTVSLSGTLADDPRQVRDIDGVYLAPEDAAPFLDYLQAEDLAGAFDAFSAAFLAAYGVGAAGWIDDIEALSLHVGEA